jgi:Rieske Fe-S protein
MSDPTLTRRQALTIATATACASCLAEALEGGERKGGSSPKADEKAEKAPPTALALGKLDAYEKPGFYDTFTKSDKIYVRRLDDRLVVMSAKCTHKGCVVKKGNEEEGDVLRCPCHKSNFDAYGTPTGGPAKTSLPRYAVTRDADGTITADLTKSFEEKEWDDPAAMVAIKKP